MRDRVKYFIYICGFGDEDCTRADRYYDPNSQQIKHVLIFIF